MKLLLHIFFLFSFLPYAPAQTDTAGIFIKLKGKVKTVTDCRYYIEAGKQVPFDKTTAHYDMSSNQTERRECNMDGTRCTTTRFTYNSEGKKTEEYSFTLDSIFDYKYTYRYTADSTFFTAYHEDGNIDEEMTSAYPTSTLGTPIMLWEPPDPKAPKITYKHTSYDKTGNWLTENTYENGKHVSVTKRTISYY